MSKNVDSLFLGFFVGFIIGILALYANIVLLGETYKDGQIDALTEKVKYELVKQENGEVVWKRIGD